MRRLGVVVIGVFLLALTGCISGFDDSIGPIDGGDSGPSYVLVEYQISTVALRADTGDEPRIVSASIGSLGTITYDPDLHVVSCDATAGDLLVYMIHLKAAEDMIDYVTVRRIDSLASGTWMRYDFIESYSMASATIELVRMEGDSKVFRVDQNTLFLDGFCDSIKTAEWRKWRPGPPFNETQQVPFYHLKDPFSTMPKI